MAPAVYAAFAGYTAAVMLATRPPSLHGLNPFVSTYASYASYAGYAVSAELAF